MKQMNSPLQAGRGFTLIELLTVIAIIGILAMILIPVAARVRESAHRAKCGSNVRQLAQACHLYANDNGVFPPTESFDWIVDSGRGGPITDQANWIQILSMEGYIDQQVDREDEVKDQITYCPSALRARGVDPGNLNTYGINFQASAGWGVSPTDPNAGTPGNVRSMDLAQEPTHTAMIMDGHWNGTTYRMHTNSPSGIAEPDFVHPPRHADRNESSSGVNVAFVDTHVRFVNRAEFDRIEEEGGQEHMFWKGRQ